MRVMVVEDDRKTAEFIRKALIAEGHVVDCLDNGEAAIQTLTSHPHDALVLDIMLPGCDGLTVLRELRKRGSKIPVLLLSARGEVNARVEGLDSGADDYLPKPFVLEELTARVRALVRRSGEEKTLILRVGDLTHRRRYRSRGSACPRAPSPLRLFESARIHSHPLLVTPANKPPATRD